jgi:hypothetical protein
MPANIPQSQAHSCGVIDSSHTVHGTRTVGCTLRITPLTWDIKDVVEAWRIQHIIEHTNGNYTDAYNCLVAAYLHVNSEIARSKLRGDPDMAMLANECKDAITEYRYDLQCVCRQSLRPTQ